MAFSVGTIRVQSPSGTGNQSYTGAGFQPKCLIWFTVVNGAIDGTVEAYTRQSCGATTGTSNRWSVGTAQDDDQSTTGNRRGIVADKVINTFNGSGTLEFVADLVSLDADGFTLNWTTTAASGIEFIFLCLGGTDLSAFVSTFDVSSGTGSQSVTGVGFEPEALIMCFGKDDTTAGNEADATLCFGVTDGTNQNVTEIFDANGLLTSNSDRIQNTSDILNLTHDATNTLNCEFSSFDSDGFTINRTTTTVTPKVGFIALRGISVKTSTFAQATGTGNSAITGVGFQPSVVLFHSVGATDTNENTHCRYTWGIGISSSNRYTLAQNSESGRVVNVVLTNCKKITDNTKTCTFLAESGDTATKVAVSDFVSQDSDGFTINWSTADATARVINYLALGTFVAPVVEDETKRKIFVIS